MVSSCWKMCTADTIITIATREKTWECLILCHFFFLSFLFRRPNFLFILLLVSLPLVDGILIYLIGAVAVYYCITFFFVCLFRYIREGAHPIVSHQHCKKKYPFSFEFFFNTSFFYMCANCCWATGWGGRRELKKNIYIYSLEHCNYRRLYIQPIAN